MIVQLYESIPKNCGVQSFVRFGSDQPEFRPIGLFVWRTFWIELKSLNFEDLYASLDLVFLSQINNNHNNYETM